MAAVVVAFARSLPDHRWLDRLVRGRAWIPLLGVLLAGIVATQVEVLKLGASMGRWVSRTAALTSQNQALQASVAALSDDQRIERLAAHMGMVMPAPTDVNFVALNPAGGIRAALGRMQAPNATQFLAALSTSQAAALAQAAPTVPAIPTSPSATATSAAQGAVTVTPTTASSTTSSTGPSSTTGTTGAAPVTTQPATTPTVTSAQPTAPSTQSTGGATSSSGGVPQTGG
ncbi:MAG TPA: hypothetical protein VE983_00690 [Solirubrobacteraceae bacterium]|nr:hypothetical protein [Solirubrobacteraceae bacterium]